jgi:predicted phosphodiesterase
VSIHVLHDVKEIDELRGQGPVILREHRPLILRGRRPLTDPVAASASVVVCGHSHKPTVTERDGVQFVNPGSAGPRRFSLPVTIAYLDITTTSARPRIVEIL